MLSTSIQRTCAMTGHPSPVILLLPLLLSSCFAATVQVQHYPDNISNESDQLKLSKRNLSFVENDDNYKRYLDYSRNPPFVSSDKYSDLDSNYRSIQSYRRKRQTPETLKIGGDVLTNQRLPLRTRIRAIEERKDQDTGNRKRLPIVKSSRRFYNNCYGRNCLRKSRLLYRKKRLKGRNISDPRLATNILSTNDVIHQNDSSKTIRKLPYTVSTNVVPSEEHTSSKIQQRSLVPPGYQALTYGSDTNRYSQVEKTLPPFAGGAELTDFVQPNDANAHRSPTYYPSEKNPTSIRQSELLSVNNAPYAPLPPVPPADYISSDGNNRQQTRNPPASSPPPYYTNQDPLGEVTVNVDEKRFADVEVQSNADAYPPNELIPNGPTETGSYPATRINYNDGSQYEIPYEGSKTTALPDYGLSADSYTNTDHGNRNIGWKSPTVILPPSPPSLSTSKEAGILVAPHAIRESISSVQTSTLLPVPNTSVPKTTQESKTFTYTVKVPPGKTYVVPPPRQPPKKPKISKTYSTHTIDTLQVQTTNFPSTSFDLTPTQSSMITTPKRDVFVSTFHVETSSPPVADTSVYTPPVIEEEPATTTTTTVTTTITTTTTTTTTTKATAVTAISTGTEKYSTPITISTAMISLGKTTTRSIPGNVPNRIKGKAHAICDEENLQFRIKTLFPFKGQIFTHNRKNTPKCSFTFNETHTVEVNLTIPYAECGIRNAEEQRAETQYHMQVIVLFEQKDGTSMVQSFVAQCIHQKVQYQKQVIPKRIEEALEELRLVPTKLEQKAMVPECKMRIVIEEEHGNDSDDTEVNLVDLGQPMRIEWSLIPESDAYGFHVRNCTVRDMVSGAEYLVIDGRGCSTDLNIFGHPHYDTYHDIARVHWHAFKIPDSSELSIKCTLEICSDIADSISGFTSCDAIPTPPFCPDIVTSPYNSILIDAEDNALRKRETLYPVEQRVHTDLCLGDLHDEYCNSEEFHNEQRKHLEMISEANKYCISRVWLSVWTGLSASIALIAVGIHGYGRSRRKQQ